MFERFTDRARTVVIMANAKATERGDQIRPVYMLHALVSAEGAAARALSSLGVDADTVERELDRTAPLGNPLEAEATSGDAEALASIGIDLDEIKRKIEENFGPGALGRVPRTQQGPFNWTGRRALTRESKQSLGLALKEARALRHNYIGTEHLLLGLLRAAEGNRRGDFTPDTLRSLGIDPVQARQCVLAEVRCASALSRPAAVTEAVRRRVAPPAARYRPGLPLPCAPPASNEPPATSAGHRSASPPRANSIDATSLSPRQHRCHIDVVWPGHARASWCANYYFCPICSARGQAVWRERAGRGMSRPSGSAQARRCAGGGAYFLGRYC